MKTRTIPVLAALLCSCVDNRASVAVVAMCAPPESCTTPSTGATCAAIQGLAQPDHFLMAAGSANGLEQTFELDNQMPDNTNADSGGVNTNDFIVDSVQLSYSAYGITIPPATVHVTPFTVPAAGSQIGSLTLIPEDTALPRASYIISAMNAAGLETTPVLVHLKVSGLMRDSSRIDLGAFDVSLNLVNLDVCDVTTQCDCGGKILTFCPVLDSPALSTATCTSPST